MADERAKTYRGAVFLHRMRQFVVLCLPPREEAILTHVEVEAFQATIPGK